MVMLYAGVVIIRSRLRKAAGQTTAKGHRQRREANERAADRAASTAVGRAEHRHLQLERIRQFVPGFTWLSLRDTVTALVHDIELARAAGDTSALDTMLTEAAVEQAMGGAALVDTVHQVHLRSLRILAADANAGGAGVRLAVTSIIDETRAGAKVTIEACEHWHMGWPPDGTAWRIISINRQWRRRLDKPVWNPDPRRPASQPRLEAEIHGRGDQATAAGIDLDAAKDAATQAITAWVTATQDPEMATADSALSQNLLAETRAWLHTATAFGFTHHLSDLVIERAVLARLLLDGDIWRPTFWVIGQLHVALRDGDTVIGEATRPWARYLSMEPHEGGWRLDQMDDDDTFVI
jgi:hypothetical protein